MHNLIVETNKLFFEIEALSAQAKQLQAMFDLRNKHIESLVLDYKRLDVRIDKVAVILARDEKMYPH
jgi:hypothetical protein